MHNILTILIHLPLVTFWQADGRLVLTYLGNPPSGLPLLCQPCLNCLPPGRRPPQIFSIVSRLALFGAFSLMRIFSKYTYPA